MMNKLGISTGAFYDMEICTEDTIEYIQELGVQSIELFIQSREELNSRYLHLIKNKLKANNMTINSIHPFMEGYEVPNLFSLNNRKFNDGLDLFYRYLEACNILGTKNLIMHGPLTQYYNADSFNRLNSLLEIANDFDVNICIENKEYTIFSSPDEFTALKNLIIFQNYRFVLDFKSAWKAGFSPLEFLNVFQEKLGFVHASFKNDKDAYYGNNFLYEDADVFNTIKGLEDNYNNVNYILEVFKTIRIEQLQKSIDYISHVIQNIGRKND